MTVVTKDHNIIKQFYQAFERLDGDHMAACYHNHITFTDPAFGTLRGEDAKNMWRMLCSSQQGKDFKVKASSIQISEDKGSAHWEAHYSFGKEKRKVHNIINAQFEIKDGKIIKHIDDFDLYRWSKQAMGMKGYLMGWTGFFQKKLQEQTHMRLQDFTNKR